MTTRTRVRRLLVGAPISVALIMSVAVVTPAAAGGCNVRNVTDGTVYSDAQDAVDDASKGDKLEIRGGCLGPVVVNRSITIVGKGVQPEIMGGGSLRAVIVAEGKTVTIKGLDIGFGYVGGTDPDGLSGWGGAIHNSGTLTLIDVDVFDSEAPYGGGIGNFGTLIIGGDSTIMRNQAGIGGGIASIGPVTIRDEAVVSGNEATGGGGGGIVVGSLPVGPPVLLTLRDDVVISGNKAQDGFAIETEGADIIIRDRVSIRGNETTGGNGIGAIRFSGGRVTLMGRASVRGNTGLNVGGIAGRRTSVRNATLTMKGSSQVRSNTGSIGGILMEDAKLTMLDSSKVRGHTAPETDAAVVIANTSLESRAAFTMKGASRVTGNAVTDGWAAVVRIACPETAPVTVQGLGSRVVGNTPRNVKPLCP